MNNCSEEREKYRTLCKEEDSIPLFSQAWMLDALAGKDLWDVVVVEKGGKVVASMPFILRKKWGLTKICQPPLCQFLGPWIKQNNGKISSKLAKEKELLNKLIHLLPRYDSFSLNWHHAQTNWLPFYWAGFSQTTLYSYRINELNDEGEIWSGFRENIRTDIRKAENRFNVKVCSNVKLDDFLELSEKTFSRQNLKSPYSRDFIYRIDSACEKRKARKIFIGYDHNGNSHAGAYVVWDKNSAYYLMGGGDPEFRNSGATSLCLWEAIKFSATVSKSFDFEGSMIEPIERFFRSFGTVQTPYFNIIKKQSKILKLKSSLQDLFKK
jgi:lipid II:glycine glycyltransferase (peptidoglycan interpeptide bridge formation enzyme)